MPASAAQRLLDAWERGRRAPAYERALFILAVACPHESPRELGALPIGERDERLLELRAQLFGSELDSVITCPACGERLEFECPVTALRGEGATDTDTVVEQGDWCVRFRLPTTDDVTTITSSSTKTPGQQLLERCLVQVEQSGLSVAFDQVPTEVFEGVSARMAAADPQADVHLELSCPTCAHRWQVPFDIVPYLWLEVDAWARRMLADVHRLASAYGWREAEILGMSAWRRQAYLDLI